MSSQLLSIKDTYNTEISENSVFHNIKKSAPIKIPIFLNKVNDNIINNETKEYNLDTHIFNPAKNSPPSEWQHRLLKRINSLQFIE